MDCEADAHCGPFSEMAVFWGDLSVKSNGGEMMLEDFSLIKLGQESWGEQEDVGWLKVEYLYNSWGLARIIHFSFSFFVLFLFAN